MNKLQPTVDLGYPTEARGKIPSFANIEEEAEFWDTHDSTDYLDDVEPIRLTRQQRRLYTLPVTLSDEEFRGLEAHATTQELSPSELAHRWLSERLRQEKRDQLPAPPEVEHGAAD